MIAALSFAWIAPSKFPFISDDLYENARAFLDVEVGPGKTGPASQ
jgi:hypothetical protein